jgi:hypothetical protein
VTAELQRFDAAVGPGRVTLRAVRIERLPAGPDFEVAARYAHGSDTVALSEERGLSVMPLDLRHELCHALDHQEGDLSGEVAADLAALDAVYPEEVVAAYADDPDQLRREIYAALCEQGPELADLAADPCGSSPPELREVAAWLQARVWAGWTAAHLGDVSVGPTLTHGLGGGDRTLTEIEVHGSLVDGSPAIQVTWYDPSILGKGPHLDVYTGEALDGAAEPVVVTEEESETAFGLPLSIVEEGGVRAAVARGVIGDLGDVYRLWIGADDGWEPIPACPPAAVWDVTVLDGRVWWVWAEQGITTSWSSAAR